MAVKPFDPTLKTLVELAPGDWAALVGEPPAPVTVIDADIGTVSGAGDKALRVDAASPYLVHLEFVVGHDVAALPALLHVRNALLRFRHELRVRSVAVLLHPQADSPTLTGWYAETFPSEEPYTTLHYRVLRIWEVSPEVLLRGGLGTLALAPIGAVTEGELPGIIKEIDRQLHRRQWRRRAPEIWAATNILMGLRYEREFIRTLMRGVLAMKESVTYQAILEEGEATGLAKGEVAEAKKFLLLQGTKRFGAPDTRCQAALEAFDDLARLEELGVRLLDAESWHDLLGKSVRRRGNGRRA